MTQYCSKCGAKMVREDKYSWLDRYDTVSGLPIYMVYMRCPNNIPITGIKSFFANWKENPWKSHDGGFECTTLPPTKEEEIAKGSNMGFITNTKERNEI